MAAELARCHPFSGNATALRAAAGICYGGPERGPDSAGEPREIIQSQEHTAGSTAAVPGLQSGLRRQPFLGQTPWAPLPAPCNSDFLHFFPPSNVILPQWSQHNGCFHTLRDKGRRLRHDTAPFRAEAGILESLKIKGNGK